MLMARDYKSEWEMEAPCLCSDGTGGTLLITETVTVCHNCGGPARQRVSYVWRGTLRSDLVSLGYGASVKHYFTSCPDCGAESVS